jgi:hypothetical protein
MAVVAALTAVYRAAVLFADEQAHTTSVDLLKHCVKDEARKKNRGVALFIFIFGFSLPPAI